MRWRGQRQSTNVEDRRGGPVGGGGLGPRGGVRRGGLGLGTIVIAFVLAWLLGVNPMTLLGLAEDVGLGSPAPTQQQSAGSARGGAPTDEMGQFIAVVLGSTEDTWTGIFRANGTTYQPPRLVIYTGSTPTGCGLGSANAGPFYCPADKTIYIDPQFYRMLAERLGAPGDFAQAYVIAHEVGHHVQNLTGIMQRMNDVRRQASRADANQLSVRLELQADCFAGIWAHSSERAKGWLERGDIEEAMRAAAAVGDDAMQRRSQGVVVPDSFTHGSAEQRARWFRTGLESGDVARCDTFAAAR